MKLTRENRSTRGKTYPSATLSTANPTWTDPESKPDLLLYSTPLRIFKGSYTGSLFVTAAPVSGLSF
jgi:hypothetical protein